MHEQSGSIVDDVSSSISHAGCFKVVGTVLT